MRRSRFSIVFASAILLSPGLMAQSTLYMTADGDDAIYTVDTATGEATLLGPALEGLSFSGLAWDVHRRILYVSDVINPAAGAVPPPDGGQNPSTGVPEGGLSGFGLGTVDLETGAVTFIGDHLSSANIHGMANDSTNDVLYGADAQARGLSVIDRDTGASTFIGTWGVTTDEIRGLAYDAASDTLYGIDWNPGALFTIDRTTGAATLVGSLGVLTGAWEGFDVEPESGLFYFVDNVSLSLATIDPSSGMATTVGSLGIGPGSQPSGLAFVTPVVLPDWVEVPALNGSGIAVLAFFLTAVGVLFLRRRAR